VGEDHTGEPQENQERLTVAQAAAALGITEGAVRSRIKRGTLPTTKERGTVFVLLGDGTSGANQTPNIGVPGDQSALIEALRDQIEDLRRERDDWKEQARMTDRLLSAAMERIPPQLEAPQEASEAAETVEAQPERAEPRTGTEGPETATERLSEAEPSVLWERVAVVILSILLAVVIVLVLGISTDRSAWPVYALLGSTALAWVVLPAVFGFLLGRKVRRLHFWRNIAPVVAILGLVSFIVGRSLGPALTGAESDFIGVFVAGIPSLVYIFAAILGNALRRRKREKLVEERPSEFSPEAVSGTQGWTSRQQAIVGLAGTIISSLIGLISTILTVLDKT
jgi:hypothetical protein